MRSFGGLAIWGIQRRITSTDQALAIRWMTNTETCAPLTSWNGKGWPPAASCSRHMAHEGSYVGGAISPLGNHRGGMGSANRFRSKEWPATHSEENLKGSDPFSQIV